MTPSILALVLAASVSAQKSPAAASGPGFKEPDRVKLIAAMDAKAAHYGDLSRKIWEYSEVGYKETKSAAAHIAELKSAGFAVQEGVASIPTAFVASWG